MNVVDQIQMNVRSLSNEKLLANLENLKQNEDKLLVQVLEHISEVERRKLYIQKGYTTLFGYLTQGLKYSENEAYRRVQSARLVNAVPEIKSDVESGKLTLTTLTDVSVALRTKEKSRGIKNTRDEKRDLLAQVTGQNRKEAQRLISDLIPEMNYRFEERKKERFDGALELTVLLLPDQRRKFEAAKDILANRGPLLDNGEAIDQLSNFYLKKKDLTQGFDPDLEALRKFNFISKKISLPLRRAVFRRDKGKCQFKNESGVLCGSTYQIELDHKIPLSAGGKSNYHNLRCLCRAHNQWKADRPIE